jgi:ferritin-like metal-binding protein YciE
MPAVRPRFHLVLCSKFRDHLSHTDQAMQALINETEKMMSMVKGDDLRDAALIVSVQKVEHYEIAAYGMVAALAGQLDRRDDQEVLHESLRRGKGGRRQVDGACQKRGESGWC